jgi:hypothetical protein
MTKVDVSGILRKHRLGLTGYAAVRDLSTFEQAAVKTSTNQTPINRRGDCSVCCSRKRPWASRWYGTLAAGATFDFGKAQPISKYFPETREYGISWKSPYLQSPK